MGSIGRHDRRSAMTMHRLHHSLLLAGILVSAGAANAQISTNAYRALGQPDLRQIGLNLVQGVELYSPDALATDTRSGVTHIYISDAGNSRILGWTDASSYHAGDPPAVVLGQPGLSYVNPLGIGTKGLNFPYGLAVDPGTGNLYVADLGNNRVLRFPAPFSNPGNYTPDAVIGQAGFNTNSAGVSSTGLNKPQAVAFDSIGNLWVGDTGNNRVLRFPPAVLDGRSGPQADLVIGQRDFASASANQGAAVSALGLNSPAGIAFDSQNNLYVADYNNGRVVKFAAPVVGSAAAVAVFGQPSLNARVIQAPSNASMAGPAGIAVSPSGALYVSVPNENRVLVFNAGSNTAATVLGQANLTSALPNTSTFPLASANGLFNPTDVKLDSSGQVYVADNGNNRVVAFAPGARSASQLWGQSNFTAIGRNQVKPASLATPYRMAIDYSHAPYPLYISDSGNHRILVWKDSVGFRTGDPADFVIGQPDFGTAIPNVDTGALSAPSATSLSSPKGVAVDSSGKLYVADSGNNRVLRYSRPVDQTGRITPDAVLGQFNFTSASLTTASGSSLQSPTGLAIDSTGELFVADTGNNRVLEYLPDFTSGASAVQVYGQPNFNSGGLFSSISAQTLNGPSGVAVDPSYNLYVADTGNNRVLVFPNTQGSHGNGLPASVVFGQPRFDSGGAGSGSGLRTPFDVALDTSGNVFVADSGNNRVIGYPPYLFAQSLGTPATGVIGQRDFVTTAPNWDTPENGLATADSLFAPLGVYVDRQNTVYVADTGNHRVLHFLRAAVIVNAAHFLVTVPVAQGSIAALGSANISDRLEYSPGVPLQTALAGREIVINDLRVAPLFAASLHQINFQVPAATSVGTNRIAVRSASTGELIAGGSFLVAAAAPGLYTASFNGLGQGYIVNQDKQLNSASHPAPKGSTITLWGTGQGQVSPPVPDGGAALSSPLSYSVTVNGSDAQTCLNSPQSMCVVFGNSSPSFGVVQFSGLAPGWVGLWQINVTIPSTAPAGNAVPVKVVIDGAPSNSITVAIQ